MSFPPKTTAAQSTKPKGKFDKASQLAKAKALRLKKQPRKLDDGESEPPIAKTVD